ncbi:MAG: 2-hydroxymuconate tautomerase [Telmatospirillum sp.]|nr:2-hydroxymuconate tautomerase [Telmatospirillum sp.]
MPICEITLVAGRTPEMKKILIRDVTDSVMRSLDVPAQSVRVILREVPPEHFAVGGVPKG